MPQIHTGTVTALGRMLKTVTVTVEREVIHPKVKKAIRRHTKYLVHDEDHIAHLNDKVEIIHGISYSNRKHFRLHTIDRRGKPKEQFLQKDPAWEKVETQLKAHLEDRAKRYADREQASFKHSATVKRMAERVHRSAMDLEGTSASKITSGQGAQQKETEKQAGKMETSKPRTTETPRTKQERKSSKQEDTATLDQAATVERPTLSGGVAS